MTHDLSLPATFESLEEVYLPAENRGDNIFALARKNRRADRAIPEGTLH
jgi:hypothetical protein